MKRFWFWWTCIFWWKTVSSEKLWLALLKTILTYVHAEINQSQYVGGWAKRKRKLSQDVNKQEWFCVPNLGHFKGAWFSKVRYSAPSEKSCPKLRQPKIASHFWNPWLVSLYVHCKRLRGTMLMGTLWVGQTDRTIRVPAMPGSHYMTTE